MTDPRLRPLVDIAGLMRDEALAGLSREVQACADLRARLAALEAGRPADPVVSPAALDAAVLLHERWVASRRRQLNEQLALRTAARLEAETKARAAFGRAQVLERLSRMRR
jgi:hypothetical protein